MASSLRNATFLLFKKSPTSKSPLLPLRELRPERTKYCSVTAPSHDSTAESKITPRHKLVVERHRSPFRRFISVPPCLRGRATLATTIGIIASIASVLQPILYAHTLTIILPNEGSALTPISGIYRQLFTRVSLQASVYAVESLGTYFYVQLAAGVIDQLIARLRIEVFRNSFQNDLTFFDVESRAVQRVLTDDIPELRNLLWMNLSGDRGLRCLFQIVIGLGLCLFLDAALTAVVFLLLLPLLVFTAGWLGLRQKDAESHYSDCETKVRFVVNQALDAIRTVKAYGGERRELESLQHNIQTALARSRVVAEARARSETMLRLSIYITLSTIYICGGTLVFIGYIGSERFLSLASFTWILLFSLLGSVYSYNDVQSMQRCLDRTYSLIDRAEDAAAEHMLPSANSPPPTKQGIEIEFKDVSFEYPTRPTVPVLQGLSLKVCSGTTVALVGPSGAGKSTIAALIARFYTPSCGSIFMNSVDIHSVEPSEYLKFVSLVDQEPKLFEGTVRANIAYGTGDKAITDTDIEKAARAANAHNFISELPQGYETVLTKGSGLSGGQRQRVSIARAILRDAPVLVLDEFSSALDAESEAAVQDALDELLVGRTVLVIAHRLSTIRNADCIMFIRDGNVVETGTYEGLMAQKNSAFRAMVEAKSEVVITDHSTM